MGQQPRQSEREPDGHPAATAADASSDAAPSSSSCGDPGGYGPFAMLPSDCLSHVLRLLAPGPPFSAAGLGGTREAGSAGLGGDAQGGLGGDAQAGLTPVPTPHDLMAAMRVCRSWAEVVVADDAIWREVRCCYCCPAETLADIPVGC
jgi:hypothetical protein